MTTTLADVVAALERANCQPTRTGADAYTAYCPVHEVDGHDHKPSLSVARGDKVDVVLNCHAGCDHKAIMAALGIQSTSKASGQRRVVGVYPYHDASGKVLFEKVRYEPKDFRIRHRDAAGSWVYKAGDGPPVLYRLPEVKAAIAEGRTIFVCEGEKDCDRLAALGLVATTNIEGAAKPEQRPKWKREYTAQLSGAARVILVPDNDAPGKAHMEHIAAQLAGKVAEVRWLALPGLPAKGDVSDWLNAGHSGAELDELAANAPKAAQGIFPAGRITSNQPSQPSQPSQTDEAETNPEGFNPIIADALARCQQDPGVLLKPEFIETWKQIRAEDPEEDLRIRVAIKHAKPNGVLLADLDKAVRGDETGSNANDITTADQLVAMVLDQADLFHDAEKNAFATLDGNRTYRLGTDAFTDWLSFNFYASTASESSDGIGKSASETALKTALITLMGIAKHDRPERPCYLRAAPWQNGYVIDLGNDAWQAVEVLPTGWRILDAAPVRFWRPNPMRALPLPQAGGSLDPLWEFINVPVETRPLVLAWLLESLRPDTPFPILELCGAQGSAKSFSQDKLRRLVDPNAVNLRAAPKTTEDLFVGAGCNWLVSLNNLSHLTAQQQDALCTLATGGGFAGRTLYTNADETLVECKRPVIINSIVPIVTAQDLTDRVIHVELPDLTEYREESALIAEFESAAPALFGALLDLFVAALARLPNVTLRKPPRMADFTKLGEAMLQASGKPAGEFSEQFAANRRQSVTRSLDASPVGAAIRELADAKQERLIFEGNMKQLLFELEPYRPGNDAWPKSPRGLSDALRRLRPALKTIGIDLSISPHGREGTMVRMMRRDGCDGRDGCSEVILPRRNTLDANTAHSGERKPPVVATANALPSGATSDAGELWEILKHVCGVELAARLAAKLGWNESRVMAAALELRRYGRASVNGPHIGLINPDDREVF